MERSSQHISSSDNQAIGSLVDALRALLYSDRAFLSIEDYVIGKPMVA